MEKGRKRREGKGGRKRDERMDYFFSIIFSLSHTCFFSKVKMPLSTPSP
jgi:hypothetical protein